MRSFLKVAVPVAMIAGVVAVIAYMTQNTARNPAKTLSIATSIIRSGAYKHVFI